MNNEDILNKENLRRSLVNDHLLIKNITGEQLNHLHELDIELLGIDIKGILFDELDSANKRIVELEAEVNYYSCRAVDAESGDCDNRIFKQLMPKISDLEAQLQKSQQQNNIMREVLEFNCEITMSWAIDQTSMIKAMKEKSNQAIAQVDALEKELK